MAKKKEHKLCGNAALWRARLKTSLEGFWFDGTLRFNPCCNTRKYRELVKLTKKFHDSIFPGKTTPINTRKKLNAVEAFLSTLARALFEMFQKGNRGCVLISQRDSHYKNKQISYRYFKTVLDYFEDKKLIQITKGFYDPIRPEKGRVSRMRPDRRFAQQVRELLAITEVEKYLANRPDNPVILRDKNKNVMPYKATRFTRHLANRIHLINKINTKARITYQKNREDITQPVNPYIYAIFNNGSWKNAGRFYGGFHSHINMTEEQRQSIRINFENVTELDYKSLHINLLYNKIGCQYTGDPYTCICKNKEMRPMLKEILLSLLNDKCSEAELINHIEFNLLNRWAAMIEKRIEHLKKVGRSWKYDSLWFDDTYKPVEAECKTNKRILSKYDISIKELVQKFKKAHIPITKFFHSGIWSEMQNTDSKIAMEVMLAFVKQGWVCLPRHDSFVVQERYRGYLKDSMKSAYQKITKQLYGRSFSVKISKKI